MSHWYHRTPTVERESRKTRVGFFFLFFIFFNFLFCIYIYTNIYILGIANITAML